MTSDDTADGSEKSLTDVERDALHEIELGLEWLQRAHGHLIEFHHATGHGMDHLAIAETLLQEADYPDLADQIRCEHLPTGVTTEDRWSYAVLEGFQNGVLADIQAFERETRNVIADGRRHVAEREQERVWRDRARE